MAYKTTGNRRSKANSAASSSTVVYNNPTGEGLAMSGTNVASGQTLNSRPVISGSTEASNNTQTVIGNVANNMTVTNVYVTDSSYNNTSQGAVNVLGGYVKIVGTNFLSGTKIYLGGKLVTSGVTVVSSTEIRIQFPATTAGTYSLMLFNGASGANWSSGLVFSGVPTITQTIYSFQGATVSVQLQATSDSALTFSIVSGSLQSGLSMSSSGLITGTPAAGTQTANFVLLVTDAENQTAQATITLTTIVGDGSFNVTQVMSHADGTNQSLNGVFGDSSNLNFPVTTVGTPAQGSFTPYGKNWATRFDGAADYLAVAASQGTINFGTGDYTIEAWVNPLSFAVSMVIIDTRVTNTSTFVQLFTTTTGTLTLFNNNANAIVGTTALKTGSWYHVAVSRASGVTRMFINGVQEGSNFTDSANYSLNEGATIGRNGSAAQNYWNGYLSNVRVIKGTALYTTTFVPSSSPLTVVTNTTVLTCGANRIYEQANGFTLTQAGNPVCRKFNPFGAGGVAYAKNTMQDFGSVYLNGTTSYLTAPNSVANFGSSNFTIECWIKPNSNSGGYNPILINTSTSDFSGWILYFDSNNTLTFRASVNGTTWASSVITSYVVPTTAWTHVAVVRNGSTVSLYANGTLIGSDTGLGSSAMFSATNQFRIGHYAYFAGSTIKFFGGLISDVRLNNTALYTGAFTPPVNTLSAVSGTTLLACQDSKAFVDNSGNNVTISLTGTPQLMTNKPYGTSVTFSGSSNYASFSNNANLAFGTGDFTIEFWVRGALADSPFFLGGRQAIGTLYITAGGASSSGASGTLRYGATNTNTTTVVLDGTWHHCAIVRASGTVTLYVDGVAGATVSDTTNYTTATGTWYIAANDASGSQASNQFAGSLSNMRIVKGTAVYTSNFTPSTTPLTAISGTQFLALNNTWLPTIDSSGNGRTLTISGTPITLNASPFLSQGTAASTYGGSVLFNGSTDYLTIADITSNMSASGTSWAYECWFFGTALSAAASIFGKRSNTSTTGQCLVQWNTNKTLSLYCASGTGSWDIVGGNSIGTAQLNQWNHVAVVRSGNTISAWLNGTRTFNLSGIGSGSSGAATPLFVGADITSGGAITNAFTGYISGMRVNAGTLPYNVSSTTITVPSTPIAPQAAGGTNLMLECLNAGQVDQTMNTNLITTAKSSTSVTKFGRSSFAYTGSEVVKLGPETATNWSTLQGLTWECWVYFPTLDGSASTGLPLIGMAQTNADGYTFMYAYGNGRIGVGINGTNEFVTAAGTITAGAWYHVAVVRNLPTFSGTQTNTIYINGVSQATTTAGVWSNNSRPLWIGAGASRFITGYIDDVRISTTARYLANFTPPASPFTDQ